MSLDLLKHIRSACSASVRLQIRSIDDAGQLIAVSWGQKSKGGSHYILTSEANLDRVLTAYTFVRCYSTFSLLIGCAVEVLAAYCQCTMIVARSCLLNSAWKRFHCSVVCRDRQESLFVYLDTDLSLKHTHQPSLS